jgi:ADP-heptose:LPS heptosyltransferase
VENILFIRLRLLGDIIFTIPSVQIYKQHFPGNHIYYVVEENFREIAEMIPGIHRVLVVPHKMGIPEILNFRKVIKAIGFNAVVDFHSGPKSALLTFATGIKTRIGYRTPNRNWAYNHLIPRRPHDFPTHSTYNQAMLLEHLGIRIKDRQNFIPPYPKIPIPAGTVSQPVKNTLKKKRPKIVIHIGAGNRFRDWGEGRFSALIERLIGENFLVFLIGNSEKEIQRGHELKHRYPVFNFTWKLSIKEVLYLISRADVYLGFDSGPLHLASLTDTPIVALYGPNIPEISGPWREKDIILAETELKCRPCSQKKCIYDTIKCIEDLSVDDVHEKIKRFSH